MNHLSKELEGSDIYDRECSIGDAWVTIDNIVVLFNFFRILTNLVDV